jgi:hypothetical protein
MESNSQTYQQLQSLLGSGGTSGSTPTIGIDTSALMASLMPFVILSVISTVLFIALYVFSLIRKFKVEKAIFESRNLLREMNERQKLALTPAPVEPNPPVQPQATTTNEPAPEQQ